MRNHQAVESHSIRSYFKPTVWILPLALALVLVLVSTVNFLLFHTLAEFFAITIAVLAFVVAWQMYPFSQNNFLMYLGCGYLWIGALDMAHNLSYKGLNLLPNATAETSTQFWIATRFLEALLLLTAPWFLTHRFNKNKVLVYFGLGSTGLIYLILFTHYFPTTFVEGKGLTPFKVNTEYVIILLLALAVVYLRKQRHLIDKRIVDVMVVSILLTMCAELAFTFYVSIYGLSNLVGHIFKMFSFWLVYLAVVRTTLQEPFTIMSKRATTYDAIPDATLVVDERGIIRQANREAGILSGTRVEDLIGRSSHSVFHQKNTNSFTCPICQAIMNGKELESLELEVDKNGVFYDFSLSPISGSDNMHGMVEVVRDISKRKQAEEKFNELNVLKNSIVEHLPNMLFVKDATEHRYVEWNRAAEELTGLLKEEMLGHSDYDFWPKEQAEFFIDKDKEVIRDNKLLDIPRELISTKNKGIRTIHTKKIPIYDEKHTPKYLLGISEDITEKLKTEDMLRHSQKMEAVGQMSGGIAHDFNNQLGVITGYLELLEEQIKDNKYDSWFNAIQSAAQRCIDLTRQLLIFSRAEKATLSNLNINHVLSEMRNMIERTVTPEVTVNYALSDDLWNTDLNSGDFQDAILNLVINARDAMPAGGTLSISTANILFKENVPVISSVELKPGEYIQIIISDTGSGMEQDVIEHIFEPFFTTKGVGKGTGLGLSMVYGFVNRYGGAIDVESAHQKGTTFKLYLPRTSNKESAFENNEVKTDFMGGSESILIVDDEAELLSLAKHLLSGLGYKIFVAENSAEALVILEQERSISLLFTDVVMPGGINGHQLAKAAQKIIPGLKVLLTSGYVDKSGDMDEINKSGFRLLNKPYRREDLALEIRQVLDK